MRTGTARPGLTSEGSPLPARPQMRRSCQTRSPSGAVTSHPAEPWKRIAMIKMRASDRDSTAGISPRAGHEGRSLDGWNGPGPHSRGAQPLCKGGIRSAPWQRGA